MLGWKPEELVNRSCFDLVHPDDVERLSNAWNSLERGTVKNLKYRLLHKNGAYRWIAWDTAPDECDSLLFCIGRDVTQTKRTLHSLRALNNRMQRANDELEHFANAAGHDLQEPLRTLSLYSELLMRQYGGAVSEGMSVCLSTISDATERMRALVESLLAYARSSKRQGHSERLPSANVCLESIFEQVLKTLASAIEECGATITHDLLPDVWGDEMQLCRLLQNLLSNSLKYRCKDGPVEIHVSVEPRGDEWLFCVKDNGPGFPASEAEHIFDPFKRLHGAGDIPGTGLGLSICRRILEQHGGRIWAESGPGAGATFLFSLPSEKRC